MAYVNDNLLSTDPIFLPAGRHVRGSVFTFKSTTWAQLLHLGSIRWRGWVFENEQFERQFHIKARRRGLIILDSTETTFKVAAVRLDGAAFPCDHSTDEDLMLFRGGSPIDFNLVAGRIVVHAWLAWEVPERTLKYFELYCTKACIIEGSVPWEREQLQKSKERLRMRDVVLPYREVERRDWEHVLQAMRAPTER